MYLKNKRAPMPHRKRGPMQNDDLKRYPFLGVHGENNLIYKGVTVVTKGIGCDPNNHHGDNFWEIRQRGRIPIVRLNNGYGDSGTIPPPVEYENFAIRVANYVRASKHASIWIIGNEPNHAQERPKWADGTKPPILPAQYARCYDLCRSSIHAISGHEADLVLLAAVSPWNNQTQYEGNEHGDWLGYYANVQQACIDIDGFAWHAYAREQTPEAITRRVTLAGPFSGHCWGFRVFEDWAAATLDQYKTCPRYITEFNAYSPWKDVNTGFVQQAARTINQWNIQNPNQQIRGLALYRWSVDRWTWGNLNNVRQDFLDACDLGFQAGDALPDNPEPEPDERPRARVWAFKLQIAGSDVGHATVEGTITYDQD